MEINLYLPPKVTINEIRSLQLKNNAPMPGAIRDTPRGGFWTLNGKLINIYHDEGNIYGIEGFRATVLKCTKSSKAIHNLFVLLANNFGGIIHNKTKTNFIVPKKFKK